MTPALVIAAFLLTFPLTLVAAVGQRRPNVVVMVADDLGIGDLGCFGNDTISTPNIDRLASEGVKLTHHLAAATLCTPSRAALLTARYAARYGLLGEEGTPPVIVHVASRAALPLEEVTLGRALAAANYTTAAVGKWHLGMMCGPLGTECHGPKKHGFQHFFGLPFTLIQDVRGDHSFWVFPISQRFYISLLIAWLLGVVTLAAFGVRSGCQMTTIVSLLLAGLSWTLMTGLVWFVHTHYRFHTAKWWQVSPWMNQNMNGILMHDDRVVEQPLVLDGLMQKLVNYSVKFIEDHAKDENPFFLYHAFAHTHTPMFVHPSMEGRSKHGRYGDNVEEMDAGVGSIMATLAAHDLDHNTIVYFVSDHGGHLECVEDNGQRVGGHNGLFKGGKGQGSSEGGIRVPGIYRWKGVIPASVSIDTPTSLMDMMPTILHLASIPPLTQLLPQQTQKELDGISIADQLQSNASSKSRILLHHCMKFIHALRWAKGEHVYKMFLKRYKFPEGSYQCGWGHKNLCSCYEDEDIEDITDDPMLFDLARDPYEDQLIPSHTAEYLEVVSHLKHHLADWKSKVVYPPSQFRSKLDTILTPWLQPFCVRC